jgi:predicted ATP-grasp superfamily ATP-dependent carboligase
MTNLPQQRWLSVLQNLGTLVLLTIALPFNLIFVLTALMGNAIVRFRMQQPLPTAAKTILLTGGKMTKALQLARSFHAAGHRVVLVETEKYWLSGHRFSRAIDRFYTIPTPQKDPQKYTQALLAIVQQEQVDIFIPVSSPIASWYDSLAKPALSQHCEVFHFDGDVTKILDDKFAFSEQARAIGLLTPKTFIITDPQQIINFDFSNDDCQYILKSISYSSVHRLDMTKLPLNSQAETVNHVQNLPICPEQPWIMQEFITGQEYCTHSTVRNGTVQLYCCAKSSAFQVNYEHVDNPQILQWVTQFVKSLNLTGQISFDLIQRADGTIFAIECNPRTHSAITMFYNHPGVADAYLSQEPLPDAPLQPLPSSKPTYWLYHEIWRLNEVRSFAQLQTWWKTVSQGKDALFALDDPLPFLTVPHWQIFLLLLDNLRKLKGWIRIDFNIGKLVEFGGD